jgi:hypothetical protein
MISDTTVADPARRNDRRGAAAPEDDVVNEGTDEAEVITVMGSDSSVKGISGAYTGSTKVAYPLLTSLIKSPVKESRPP